MNEFTIFEEKKATSFTLTYLTLLGRVHVEDVLFQLRQRSRAELAPTALHNFRRRCAGLPLHRRPRARSQVVGAVHRPQERLPVRVGLPQVDLDLVRRGSAEQADLAPVKRRLLRALGHRTRTRRRRVLLLLRRQRRWRRRRLRRCR